MAHLCAASLGLDKCGLLKDATFVLTSTRVAFPDGFFPGAGKLHSFLKDQWTAVHGMPAEHAFACLNSKLLVNLVHDLARIPQPEW